MLYVTNECAAQPMVLCMSCQMLFNTVLFRTEIMINWAYRCLSETTEINA